MKATFRLAAALAAGLVSLAAPAADTLSTALFDTAPVVAEAQPIVASYEVADVSSYQHGAAGRWLNLLCEGSYFNIA